MDQVHILASSKVSNTLAYFQIIKKTQDESVKHALNKKAKVRVYALVKS
jgi:hypothetical protein